MHASKHLLLQWIWSRADIWGLVDMTETDIFYMHNRRLLGYRSCPWNKHDCYAFGPPGLWWTGLILRSRLKVPRDGGQESHRRTFMFLYGPSKKNERIPCSATFACGAHLNWGPQEVWHHSFRCLPLLQLLAGKDHWRADLYVQLLTLRFSRLRFFWMHRFTEVQKKASLQTSNQNFCRETQHWRMSTFRTVLQNRIRWRAPI